MKKHLAARAVLAYLGLGHLLALYVYGLTVQPVLTGALALAWIMLVLTFWREEK